jgi:hypothetical protein
MNTVVADQHGVRNLTGTRGEDEIEGEARFAGARRTADQDGAIAGADRRCMDAAVRVPQFAIHVSIRLSI